MMGEGDVGAGAGAGAEEGEGGGEAAAEAGMMEEKRMPHAEARAPGHRLHARSSTF